MNILIVDVGTSSMRGILYCDDGKKILIRRIKYRPVYRQNGWVEQPASDFSGALTELLKAASSGGTDVDAVAVTAQRSSVIPVDKEGLPLADAIMWQDNRTLEIGKELHAYNQRVKYLSGASINPVFSGSKMLWLKRNKPQIYNKAFKLVNIPEYLLHLMTGEFVSDHTYGSRSNLMNIRSREWDKELLEIFELDEKYLCRLTSPGDIAGYLTPSYAAVTGMRSGIPVISSGGDQQCAAIGNGAYKNGNISVVTGTGAFLATTCDNVPEDLEEDMICNCASVRGKYIIEANVLTCCSAFDWFCRNFYGCESIDYEGINRDLEGIYENISDCIVLPYFQGKYSSGDKPVKAFIGNITLGTEKRELLKAILEGIFMEIDNNMCKMKKYIDINCAYISGGLTNSRVMNQMQADIYGMPLYRMNDAESTALGAFLAARQGLGLGTVEDEFLRFQNLSGVEKYDHNIDMHKKYLAKKDFMNCLYKKIYG